MKIYHRQYELTFEDFPASTKLQDDFGYLIISQDRRVFLFYTTTGGEYCEPAWREVTDQFEFIS